MHSSQVGCLMIKLTSDNSIVSISRMEQHQSFDWVELADPSTKTPFWANVRTGQCIWVAPNPPERIRVSNPDDFWELWDSRRSRPYYYSVNSGKSDWTRPKDEHCILPLIAIQQSSLGERLSTSMAPEQAIPVKSKENSPRNIFRPAPLPGSEPPLPPPASPRLPAKLVDRASSTSSRFTRNGTTTTTSSDAHHLNTDGGNGLHGTLSVEVSSQMPSPKSPRRPGNLDNLAVPKTVEPLLLPVSPASPRPKGSQDNLLVPYKRDADIAAKARAGGIGAPVLNESAAKLLNPLNQRSPSQLSSASDKPHSYRSLPQDLSRDITQFRIEGFAKQYFSEHRKGLLRRRVPPEKMLEWSKDTMKSPLLILNKSVHKDAMKSFKSVQQVMGDRGGKPLDAAATVEEMQRLLEMGINKGVLRDEILVQVCKQLTRNPHKESEYKGWELMGVLLIGFPPSKNFEHYLESFIAAGTRSEEPRISALAFNCQKKLVRIGKSGPRGKVPAAAEVERARVAAYSPSVFGETLEEVMTIQAKDFPEDEIPRVMVFLARAVLKLGGCKTEGIFRVPGDADSVAELKCRIENRNYDVSGIFDPSVPASLLKLWMRELADPIIPVELYDQCIGVGRKEMEKRNEATENAWDIVKQLPPLSRAVANYMVQFLRIVADPEHQKITKMTLNNLAMVFAPNFLRCPSDNPTLIFENTKFEQSFLKLLIMSGGDDDYAHLAETHQIAM
ncbi:hypothetical protein M427DRAFT_502256 [Gonapodya prolifera JEL478]|uniref:RhoGAP-domain-containing protein n=1 Tax=Gonapodya prolifera (strain JEL478) TaxID=1344416 RepID=A0A139A769_GONPJ|nr:hypothetical protein M427DRAFT_502256 [Gonapodya prolifera JEL478]|eukprot:KXS12662.1 hypothetical protein M427DRAFT_502256 [Gonapodya prolifera JEL478]